MLKTGKNTKSFLTGKLLCICPLCKKNIYGKDIDITEINISKIKRWPFSIVYCHAHNSHSIHALTIYLDANFGTRGREVSPYLKIQT